MKKLLLAAVVACAAMSAQAQTSNISAKISSLGFGLEYDYAMAPNLEVGVTGHYFSWKGLKFKTKDGQAEHSLDLSMSNIGVVGNYYPIYGSGLVLRGGVFYNGNSISGRVPYKESTWNFSAHYNKVAPMLGVGWYSTLPGTDNLGFAFNAGLFYQGKATISKLTVDCKKGTSCSSKDEKSSVETHIREHTDMGLLQVYPVISASLTYRF